LLLIIGGFMFLSLNHRIFAQDQKPLETKISNNADEIDNEILDKSVKSFEVNVVIPATIRPKKTEIQNCYDKELENDKNLEGKLRVDFTITEKGTTSGIKVSSETMKNKNLENCIAGIFSNLTFPQNEEGGIEASYPFNFRKPTDDAAKDVKTEVNREVKPIEENSKEIKAQDKPKQKTVSKQKVVKKKVNEK